MFDIKLKLMKCRFELTYFYYLLTYLDNFFQCLFWGPVYGVPLLILIKAAFKLKKFCTRGVTSLPSWACPRPSAEDISVNKKTARLANPRRAVFNSPAFLKRQ
jgi:hypothetical protein